MAGPAPHWIRPSSHPRSLRSSAVYIFLSLSPALAAPFVVSGGNAVEKARMVRRAEDVARQLGQVLGQPVPGKGERVVVLELGEDQEYLVRQLLRRLIESRRQTAGLAASDRPVPQWLSEGLSRCLDTGRLVRDRKLTAIAGQDPGSDTIGDVISWETLPEGWEGRKALCGSLVAWMLSCPHGINPVLDRLAAGKPVTTEWLAEAVAGTATVVSMETRWRAWRHRREATIQDFGELSLSLIDQLKTGVKLELPSPGRGQEETGQTGRRLPPGEVIAAYKKQPGVVGMQAAMKMQGIHLLTLGKAPELMEAGERYAWFYEAVARGRWTWTLRWRLHRAETFLQRLESLTLARTAWLDEVEKGQGAEGGWQRAEGGGERGEDATVIPELEKSRIESYLDEVEKRFHKK